MQKLRLFGMNGVFALILACTAGIARGQQAGYLILIDAENKQPFTARIGETLMSSSDHGHLLISQLKDSSYRVVIRFPRSAVEDQVFPVELHKKDLGLQLREAGSSWVLYNWQSRETIKPVPELDSSLLLDQGVKRDDGFSRLMASVVNDTSVMYNTFTWNNVRDTLKGKPGEDSSLIAVRNPMNPGGLSPDSTQAAGNNKKPGVDSTRLKKKLVKAVPQRALVKKLRDVSLKISRKMVFQDISPEGEKDTITLFVFFEKPEPRAKQLHEDPMVTARRLLKNDTARIKRNKPGDISSLPENDLAGTKDSLLKDRKVVKRDSAGAAAKRVAVCLQEATDPDVEALRSAILVRNTEDEKISVAAGAFAMKCFSAIQLRLLGDLFVSDKAKYRFLRAAHGHVTDPDHFQELVDLLADKTYIKKFRTLLQKPG